jgi:hypothetical protein
MSLILEALKKLEREKKLPERGFLVTAAAAWPARTSSLVLAAYLGGGALLVGGGALGAWLAMREAPQPLASQAATSRTSLSAAPVPALPMPTHSTLPAPALPVRTLPAVAAASPLPLPPPVAALPESRPRAASAAPKVLPPAARATPGAATADATAASREPSPTPAPPQDGVRLSAISRRDGKPIAIVNDRLVHEGDSFENVRVIRIGDAEVELEVDGKRRVVGF